MTPPQAAKFASDCLGNYEKLEDQWTIVFIMLKFNTIDLGTDAMAATFVKTETVNVIFAKADGELASREGINRFVLGDALITGATHDRWSVSRNRFDAKYDPVAPLKRGDDGNYRSKPVPVLACQMAESFTITRSAGGDVLQGLAQDWLLQYAPGDHGIVENARFLQVYRRVEK